MNRSATPPSWLQRVVFVCRQIPEGGGGGTAVEVLSAAFSDAGIAVEHLSVFPGSRAPTFPTITMFRLGEAHRRPAVRGTSGPTSRARGVFLLLAKRADLWVGRRKLRRLLRGAGRDTVVVFSNVYGKKVLDEAKFTHDREGPILIGQHHSSYEGAARSWELAGCRVHFRDVDAFVALTAADADKFRRDLEILCTAVPNIAPDPIPLDGQKEQVAVALARLSPEKRIDLMIKAFADATTGGEYGRWQLRIYGEGDCRSELSQLISALGIGDRVVLMGRTSDVRAALEPASLHLLTSEWEGLPMAILEAAAYGVPTLAMDCSAGVRELVSHGAGLLVPANDLDAFTVELRTLLTSDAKIEDMREPCQSLASSYRTDAVLAQWFDLFDRLDHGRSSR